MVNLPNLCEFNLEKAQEEDLEYKMGHLEEQEDYYPIYKYYKQIDEKAYIRKLLQARAGCRKGSYESSFDRERCLHAEEKLSEDDGRYYEEIEKQEYDEMWSNLISDQMTIDSKKMTHDEKERYIQRHKKFKKILKGEDEIKDMFWSDITDSQLFFDDVWGYFLECLTDKMKQRNQSKSGHRPYWETPNSNEDNGSEQFSASDGEELLHHFDITRFCSDGPNKVSVSEYGKNGLFIDTDCRLGRDARRNDLSDIRVLPSCHDGFYRDWDRDGICVQLMEDD